MNYIIGTPICTTYIILACPVHLQETILHLSVKNPKPEVSIVVLEAFKRNGLLQKALCLRNKHGDSPLNVAVKFGNVQNVILLHSECQKACPHVITEAEDGESSVAPNIHVQSF